MQILAIRTRMADPKPLYAYRVYVPFHQLSSERQGLIHYRTSFGYFRSDDYLARLADVIAPMAHLQRPPGFDRYVDRRDLYSVADRLEAILIGHVFPEMTATSLPLLYEAKIEAESRHATIRTTDLTGAFEMIRGRIDTITAGDLGIKTVEGIER